MWQRTVLVFVVVMGHLSRFEIWAATGIGILKESIKKNRRRSVDAGIGVANSQHALMPAA